MSSELTRGRRIWMGIALIMAAVYYRPLVLWSRNPWDMAAPQEMFFTASIAVVAGVLFFLLLMRTGLRELPAAVLLAGLAFILFNFHDLPLVHGVLWLFLVALLSIGVHSWLDDQFLPHIVVIFVAIVALAPAVQVIANHVFHRDPYPLRTVATAVSAEPSGLVEDVLVLVVDSYPMLAVAQQWLNHDTGLLEETLSDAGFVISSVSWSHNTFTSLAVPTMLQLQQVADDSPKGSWGNRRSNYEIVGGENLVATALRDAGFMYTHAESGWDGGACRDVDVCLESSWLDEAGWALLAPSVFHAHLVEKHGSMSALNTFRMVDHLMESDLFTNGTRQYVYAHMMLPHAPYVVDEVCRVIPGSERDFAHDELTPIRRQLACVDSLLMEIVGTIDDETAVLIAADHGLGLRRQVGKPANEWDDADIADRLGALLAYRLPEECDEPRAPTNAYAMRAIMECAVVSDLPTDPIDFLIGLDQPEKIEPEQLSDIGQRLSGGTLTDAD